MTLPNGLPPSFTQSCKTTATVCGCRGSRYCLVCQPKRVSPNMSATGNDVEAALDLRIDAVICLWCRNLKHFSNVSWELTPCGLWVCPRCRSVMSYDLEEQSLPQVLEVSTNAIKSLLQTCDGSLNDQQALCSDFDKPFGVTLFLNIITPSEEKSIIYDINSKPWSVSQSGRRKQDYGVQVNFTRRKVKLGRFNGLPQFAQTYLLPMFSPTADSQSQTHAEFSALLRGFRPVELCNLEYIPERGSAIAPHIDDTWIWGERLVTFNLLSATYLTFIRDNIRIRVPLPQRSAVIVQNASRYIWQHAIFREDIRRPRLAITLRELSQEFQENGPHAALGAQILEIASRFDGEPTGA